MTRFQVFFKAYDRELRSQIADIIKMNNETFGSDQTTVVIAALFIEQSPN